MASKTSGAAKAKQAAKTATQPAAKPDATLAGEVRRVGRSTYKDRSMKPERLSTTVLVVRPGRVLMWPNGELRGGQGYLVAADDPFIQGSSHVLKPAPEGSRPAPIDNPLYVAKMRRNASGKSEAADRSQRRRVKRRDQAPKADAALVLSEALIDEDGQEVETEADGDDLPESER